MISSFCTPQENPSSTTITPDETTPELRPWTTPHVQSLYGAGRDTQGGTVPSDIEDFLKPGS
jgi:hypothetical protein